MHSLSMRFLVYVVFVAVILSLRGLGEQGRGMIFLFLPLYYTLVLAYTAGGVGAKSFNNALIRGTYALIPTLLLGAIIFYSALFIVMSLLTPWLEGVKDLLVWFLGEEILEKMKINLGWVLLWFVAMGIGLAALAERISLAPALAPDVGLAEAIRLSWRAKRKERAKATANLGGLPLFRVVVLSLVGIVLALLGTRSLLWNGLITEFVMIPFDAALIEAYVAEARKAVGLEVQNVPDSLAGSED